MKFECLPRGSNNQKIFFNGTFEFTTHCNGVPNSMKLSSANRFTCNNPAIHFINCILYALEGLKTLLNSRYLRAQANKFLEMSAMIIPSHLQPTSQFHSSAISAPIPALPSKIWRNGMSQNINSSHG